jgi:hypothetical protein
LFSQFHVAIVPKSAENSRYVAEVPHDVTKNGIAASEETPIAEIKVINDFI